MPERDSIDCLTIPSTSPPDSHKPRKRRYHRKVKSGPESSHIDIDQVDPPSTTVPEAEGSSVPSELKLSPIDLINKRLKATSKKIARITLYASTDPRRLNADQKRLLQTLPILEAIQKELSEVKNAIEETDAANDLILNDPEAENAENVANTVDTVQAEETTQHVDSQLRKKFVTRTIDLVNVLRYSLLVSGKSDTSSTDEAGGSIVHGVADALLGADEDRRRATVEGFLQESDNFDGISYTLFVEIAKAGLALPRIPEYPLADTAAATESAEDVADRSILYRGLHQTKEIDVIQESKIEESSGGIRLTDVMRTKLAEELQRKTEEDEATAAAEVEQNKRKEQRKREEAIEQKYTKEWRLVDQLKQDREEKRREEEQYKEEEKKWFAAEWGAPTWRSRGATGRERSSSDVTSGTRSEMQNWEDPEFMWPSLFPVHQGSNATWAAGPTKWGESEVLNSVGDVKAPEMGKSFAQVASRSRAYWRPTPVEK